MIQVDNFFPFPFNYIETRLSFLLPFLFNFTCMILIWIFGTKALKTKKKIITIKRLIFSWKIWGLEENDPAIEAAVVVWMIR